MPITLKINENVEILETAVVHHLRNALEKFDRAFWYMFQKNISNKSVRVYSLFYSSTGDNLNHMGDIKLRKLGSSKIELTISDPDEYQKLQNNFPDEKTDKKPHLREEIITYLMDGLREDNLLSSESNKSKPSTMEPKKEKANLKYINLQRLQGLKSIASTEFDLSKLIQLCEELNNAYDNQGYFSIAMLLRAILDHVPPIFRFKTFEQVVAQYGNKSFKANMEHLEKSLRKIADSYLHLPIRKQEMLPNQNQVNFSADLDVLLAEITRVLRLQTK